jgi:hypothetical protein
VSLARALEAAASALPEHEDAIRPANGDPERLLAALTPLAATQVLGWLLDNHPDDGEELALAWADLETGSAPLRGVADGPIGKAGRKALRRVQHRLRSRGIEVAAAPVVAHVATLPKLDDEINVALVSPPDPSGAQLVVVVESSPSGGTRIFQGAVDLERGILEFRVLQANRSQARRLLRDLDGNEALAATEAPREAVAALLARGAEAQPADRALPQAFGEWRSRVARAPAGAATPGGLARAALDPTPLAPSLLREVAEAVEAGGYGPWPPAFEVLHAVAGKVRDAAKSQLLVDDQQRRAHVDATIGDALESRYAPPAAERTAARFEELGYTAWKRGRAEEARRCLAAARAFREQPPRENPVARALLDRALRPLLDVLREEEASSPLVRP